MLIYSLHFGQLWISVIAEKFMIFFEVMFYYMVHTPPSLVSGMLGIQVCTTTYGLTLAFYAEYMGSHWSITRRRVAGSNTIVLIHSSCTVGQEGS